MNGLVGWLSGVLGGWLGGVFGPFGGLVGQCPVWFVWVVGWVALRGVTGLMGGFLCAFLWGVGLFGWVVAWLDGLLVGLVGCLVGWWLCGVLGCWGWLVVWVGQRVCFWSVLWGGCSVGCLAVWVWGLAGLFVWCLSGGGSGTALPPRLLCMQGSCAPSQGRQQTCPLQPLHLTSGALPAA